MIAEALGLLKREVVGKPVRSASMWNGCVPMTCANKSANLVSSNPFNSVVLNWSPLKTMTESCTVELSDYEWCQVGT